MITAIGKIPDDQYNEIVKEAGAAGLTEPEVIDLTNSLATGTDAGQEAEICAYFCNQPPARVAASLVAMFNGKKDPEPAHHTEDTTPEENGQTRAPSPLPSTPELDPEQDLLNLEAEEERLRRARPFGFEPPAG
jgi:hypothetical protein